MNAPSPSRADPLPSAFDPGTLCRQDAALVSSLRGSGDVQPRYTLGWSVLVIAGMALYGAAFGVWRHPLQALYGAIKMPLMLHAVVWLSVVINALLNWLLGARLSFRQVRQCVLGALAVLSVTLGALSPVVGFLVLQVSPPGTPGDRAAYRGILAALVATVGAAGLLGYARLFRLLRAMSPAPAAAARTLAAWILITGLVGTQCSWLLSPFVQQPSQPVTFWNPLAFQSNFFEYLWEHVAKPLLG